MISFINSQMLISEEGIVPKNEKLDDVWYFGRDPSSDTDNGQINTFSPTRPTKHRAREKVHKSRAREKVQNARGCDKTIHPQVSKYDGAYHQLAHCAPAATSQLRYSSTRPAPSRQTQNEPRNVPHTHIHITRTATDSAGRLTASPSTGRLYRARSQPQSVTTATSCCIVILQRRQSATSCNVELADPRPSRRRCRLA